MQTLVLGRLSKLVPFLLIDFLRNMTHLCFTGIKEQQTICMQIRFIVHLIPPYYSYILYSSYTYDATY